MHALIFDTGPQGPLIIYVTCVTCTYIHLSIYIYRLSKTRIFVPDRLPRDNALSSCPLTTSYCWRPFTNSSEARGGGPVGNELTFIHAPLESLFPQQVSVFC
jgi:hypothetical protein